MSGRWSSYGFGYKPSITTQSSTDKVAFDSSIDIIDARLSKEIWVGDPNYGTTLQNAVTIINTIPCILCVPSGTWTIGSNFTIPSNIVLCVMNGASINVLSDVTLIINGCIDAGPYQIFTGDGIVIINSTSCIKRGEWIGNSGIILPSFGDNINLGQHNIIIESSLSVDNSTSGLIINMIYGESLIPSDLVYIKSDGTVCKADADGSNTYPVVGMALETANNSSHKILLDGVIRMDSWSLTVGGLVYLDTVAGGLTQTEPTDTDNVIQIIGIAINTNIILFRPSLDYITHI